MLSDDEYQVDGETGIAPLEIATLTLGLKIMPDGRKAMSFLAETPEGEVPSLFDLFGMLGFAQLTIADPEWQASAYEYDGDEE